MSAALPPQPDSAFATVRQFARKRATRAVEHCEMCSRQLPPEHTHLVDPATRKLICACEACATLFEGHPGTKYRRVPRQAQFLRDFRLTDAQWDSLLIPIEMAFLFKSSTHNRVIALYPSPAGAMESLLSLDTWTDIEEANPILLEMQPDVSALLVNRVGQSRRVSAPEYFIVPIDECFKLVGLIRSHWRGLTGGTEVWREIAQFFATLKSRAGFVAEDTYA